MGTPVAVVPAYKDQFAIAVDGLRVNVIVGVADSEAIGPAQTLLKLTELAVTDGGLLIVIVPSAFTVPQPPDRATLYANGLPKVEVGVPLIVTVPAVALPAKVATNPAGKFTAPIPVAPVVVNTIFGLSAWFKQIVALGATLVAVIVAPTVSVPEAGALAHAGVVWVLITTV